MAIVNSLLVIYDGGRSCLERTDAASITQWGRQEDMLSLPDVVDPTEAARQADQKLLTLAHPKSTVTAEYNPRTTAELPGVGWREGDTIKTPEQGTGTSVDTPVPSYSFSTDEDGEIIVTPTLETRDEIIEERYSLYFNRLGIGLLGGASGSATLAPDEFDSLKTGLVLTGIDRTFSFPGLNTGTQMGGAPYESRTRLNRIGVTWNRDPSLAPTGSTTIGLYRDDGAGAGWVLIQSEVIPATSTRTMLPFTITGQFIPPQGQIQVIKITDGAHQDMVVTVFGSSPK